MNQNKISSDTTEKKTTGIVNILPRIVTNFFTWLLSKIADEKKPLRTLPANIMDKYKNANYDKIMTLIEKTTIEPITNLDITTDDWLIRQDFCDKISFAIPSRFIINSIADFVDYRTILEVGAGSGIWARLLSDVIGTDQIIATDSFSLNNQRIMLWYNVEKIDCVAAVEKYSEAECLFICWCHNILSSVIEKFAGDRIIIIGEDYSSSTDYLCTNTWSNYTLVNELSMQRWPGYNDSIRFYIKNCS